MKPIIRAALASIISLSFTKNLLESIFKWDFKEGDSRENLMQLCFSSLSVWFLLVILLVISLDPFAAGAYSNMDAFAENRILLFLLDGHMPHMIAVFAVAFVVTWLFRQEILFTAVLAYLVKHSWLHINLAVAGTLAILLSSLCYRWWAVMDIKSEARKIWNRIHQLQLISFIFTFFYSFYELDFMLVNGILGDRGIINRVHFLIFVLVIYYALNFILMSIYGHFYFHQKKEPSEIQVYFSTSNWILRFKLSESLRAALKKKAENEMVKHQTHLKSFNELKASSPGLSKLPLEGALQSEIEYLKEAIVRLSKA
jgi:hypothetical protein